MKTLKENLKLVFWSSLIAATLILALSCKKREPEIKLFEGSWYKNTATCPQASTPLKIEFVKVIGAKSKHRNKYKIVGGQGTFLCASTDQDAYYMDEFTFESVSEGASIAEAHDGKELTFKVENSDVMRITCNGVKPWKLTLSRVK